MKTLEQYIAERRRILEPDGSQEWISAFFKDSEKHMPRVLDMLEKAIKTLAVYSRDTFDPSRAIGAGVALKDLEKMVNE